MHTISEYRKKSQESEMLWQSHPCGSTKEYITRIPYLNYVSGGVVHPQKNPMKKVAEALNLTNKQIPLNIIFTGHSDQTPEPRDQYEEKRIHWL